MADHYGDAEIIFVSRENNLRVPFFCECLKIKERKKANRTLYRRNSDLLIQNQNPPSVQQSTAFLNLSG